jgi:hypothetical protein
MAGFIATPGVWEKVSKRAPSRLAGTRNASVIFVTLIAVAQFEHQFKHDRTPLVNVARRICGLQRQWSYEQF